MHVHGRCHCGAIAFEAEVEPGTIAICHCTDCQTLSGTAYRPGISAKAETFVLTGIEPSRYVKTGTSGAKRTHAFCPICGTPIYSAAVENPDRYTLRVGTIAERKALGVPQRQQWCVSALPWAETIADAPKLARQ